MIKNAHAALRLEIRKKNISGLIRWCCKSGTCIRTATAWRWYIVHEEGFEHVRSQRRELFKWPEDLSMIHSTWQLYIDNIVQYYRKFHPQNTNSWMFAEALQGNQDLSRPGGIPIGSERRFGGSHRNIRRETPVRQVLSYNDTLPEWFGKFGFPWSSRSLVIRRKTIRRLCPLTLCMARGDGSSNSWILWKAYYH